MKDGYCIQSDLIEMRIDMASGTAVSLTDATFIMVKAINNLSSAVEDTAKHLEGMALIISQYELDRAYFAAGGLSDLALMRGQPF